MCICMWMGMYLLVFAYVSVYKYILFHTTTRLHAKIHAHTDTVLSGGYMPSNGAELTAALLVSKSSAEKDAIISQLQV